MIQPGLGDRGQSVGAPGSDEPMSGIKLFVYGLLMGPEGLRDALGERKSDTLRLRPARLQGWRRIWNVYLPDWNGATLNVEPRPEDSVVGVLVEGLAEQDLGVLDRLQANLLPREIVYVQPVDGEPVSAQMYHRRRGNHQGRPSGRYRSVVQQRAYRASWEVYERVCRGTVDARGQHLTFG